MTESLRYWAVIPAAGTGKRMQVDCPKQYLEIHGKPVIEYTLEAFCSHPQIDAVVVALSADDNLFDQLAIAGHEKIRRVTGGEERCHSVLNALHYLSDHAGSRDWVLVHDAARPCIDESDITFMIERLSQHPAGGLLGLPVRDTMKRIDANNEVVETVERAGLWHALTPQMFRLEALVTALEAALTNGRVVTDEAQAMELAGHRPMLVNGRPENLKITHSDDLALADIYLKRGIQDA